LLTLLTIDFRLISSRLRHADARYADSRSTLAAPIFEIVSDELATRLQQPPLISIYAAALLSAACRHTHIPGPLPGVIFTPMLLRATRIYYADHNHIVLFVARGDARYCCFALKMLPPLRAPSLMPLDIFCCHV